MKTRAIVMALLSAGCLVSKAVNAAPASATLEWRGFVPGAFNGTDIALTGSGGGDIQTGVLNIDSDGSFTSLRSIVVEAHGVDTSGENSDVSEDFYDGDVDWNLSSISVSHAAYDSKNIVVSLNGEEMEKNTPITTTEGHNVATFDVSSSEPANAEELNPGDVVSVTAMVFAEKNVGMIPNS